MKKLFAIGLLMFFFAFIASAVTESPPINGNVGITCTISDQDTPAIFTTPEMNMFIQVERGVSVPILYLSIENSGVAVTANKTEAITNINFNQDFTCMTYYNKQSWQNDILTIKDEKFSTQVNNYRAREKI